MVAAVLICPLFNTLYIRTITDTLTHIYAKYSHIQRDNNYLIKLNIGLEFESITSFLLEGKIGLRWSRTQQFHLEQ